MICPQCQKDDSRVLDTRVQKNGDIRRRRECLSCKTRFSTLEAILQNYPHITKKDGCYEPFSKEKLRKGIQLACLKRPVSMAQIEHIVDKISRRILEQNEKAFASIDVGQLVMIELKNLDDVAYIRFASVYRTFQDINEFVQTLEFDDEEPEVTPVATNSASIPSPTAPAN